MIKGFRDFIFRGNVVDLAVAVIIGAAFGGIVKAFADDFIGGLIGAIGGSPDFGRAGVTLNDSKIIYGSTLTALINFLIVAAVVYVVIVVPMKRVQERFMRADEEGPTVTDEARILAEIRDELRNRPA